MSFSSEVKKELLSHVPKKKDACLAEMAAMLSFLGRIGTAGGISLDFDSDNKDLVAKYFTLRAKTSSILSNERLLAGEDAERLLQQVKKWGDVEKEASSGVEDASFCLSIMPSELTAKDNCRRAYIRGAFLSAGSISDPNKGYHLEIVCHSEEQADALKGMIACFDIEAKTVIRKNHYVVYIKEGSQIVDLLNVMEAHISLMNLENIRIVKQVRNSVNRQVNCETANLNNTVAASVRQREDILLIQEKIGLSALPEGLSEIASIRLEYPDMNLKDLGECLDPPVGKSGVNHRLRKLHEIADGLRD